VRINYSFFYIYIFAVLVPDLIRLSCHSVQQMPLKMNTRHQAHKPSKSATTGADFQNGMVKRVKVRQRAKFCGDRSNRRRDMTIFRFFQDGGRRHLGFFKFEFFNGRTAEEGQIASPCQIWSKSVKPRPRYDDFSIFPI